MSENSGKHGDKNAAEGGIVLKKQHIIIIVLIVLLLVGGGVLIGLNWNSWFGGEKPPSSQTAQTSQSGANVELDPNAGEYTGSKPEDKGGAAQGIKIPGYPSITIEKDTTDVTMALLNPEGNPCYFKFEIALKDGDETIYESKYVEPGKSISSVTLSKPLAEGEYPAVIKITTLSLDGKTPLNGANVETILIAK